MRISAFLAVSLMVLGVVAQFAVYGLLIYAAWHYISKFW